MLLPVEGGVGQLRSLVAKLLVLILGYQRSFSSTHLVGRRLCVCGLNETRLERSIQPRCSRGQVTMFGRLLVLAPRTFPTDFLLSHYVSVVYWWCCQCAAYKIGCGRGLLPGILGLGRMGEE